MHKKIKELNQKLRQKNIEVKVLELLLKKTTLASYPTIQVYGINNSCNLRCKMCKARTTGNNAKEFKNINNIIEALPYAKEIQLTGIGEPLLYSNLDVLSQIVGQYPDNTVSTITNGLLIDNKLEDLKGFTDITISFDSISKSITESLRTGSKFEKIIGNTKLLRATYPDKKIGFSTVISRLNLNEISEIIKLSIDLGINIIDFNPINSPDDLNFLNLKQSDWDLYNQQVEKAYEILNTEIIKQNKSSFINFLAANKNKKILFYGAGRFANKIMEQYNLDFSNILGFIDTDNNKQDQMLGSYKVYPIIELSALNADIVILTTKETKDETVFINKLKEENNLDFQIVNDLFKNKVLSLKFNIYKGHFEKTNDTSLNQNNIFEQIEKIDPAPLILKSFDKTLNADDFKKSEEEIFNELTSILEKTEATYNKLLEEASQLDSSSKFKMPYCLAPWFFSFVKPDSSLKPCCRFNYYCGSVENSNFMQAWNSQEYIKLRKAMFFESKMPQRCKDCVSGFKTMCKDDVLNIISLKLVQPAQLPADQR